MKKDGLPMRRYLQLATIAAALFTPALTARAVDVPYISGGVGVEERDGLRARERDYNLKIVTSAKSGDYLSRVRIVIESASKEQMLETTMEGPILLVKLPPGPYTIRATAGSQTQSQTVTVAGEGLRQVDFRWAESR
jgi:hypothetical protein